MPSTRSTGCASFPTNKQGVDSARVEAPARLAMAPAQPQEKTLLGQPGKLDQRRRQVHPSRLVYLQLLGRGYHPPLDHPGLGAEGRSGIHDTLGKPFPLFRGEQPKGLINPPGNRQGCSGNFIPDPGGY